MKELCACTKCQHLQGFSFCLSNSWRNKHVVSKRSQRKPRFFFHMALLFAFWAKWANASTRFGKASVGFITTLDFLGHIPFELAPKLVQPLRSSWWWIFTILVNCFLQWTASLNFHLCLAASLLQDLAPSACIVLRAAMCSSATNVITSHKRHSHPKFCEASTMCSIVRNDITPTPTLPRKHAFGHRVPIPAVLGPIV